MVSLPINLDSLRFSSSFSSLKRPRIAKEVRERPQMSRWFATPGEPLARPCVSLTEPPNRRAKNPYMRVPETPPLPHTRSGGVLVLRRCAISLQALFCRRRHQPRRPPPAKIRPGAPCPGSLDQELQVPLSGGSSPSMAATIRHSVEASQGKRLRDFVIERLYRHSIVRTALIT
jgi:hypothetical protein